MKRREFITLLGGAAAWPLAARAQERIRRIGILMNATAEEPEAQTYVAAFQQGLQEFGWSVGRNLRIDLRWGGGDMIFSIVHSTMILFARITSPQRRTSFLMKAAVSAGVLPSGSTLSVRKRCCTSGILSTSMVALAI